MIVDAWMQHPTRRFLDNDMFASLRRWSGAEIPEGELPFGSNYPMIFPGHALEGLAELGLDEEGERSYLHENTRRVFGLAAPAP
jgi:hypothetical protein